VETIDFLPSFSTTERWSPGLICCLLFPLPVVSLDG